MVGMLSARGQLLPPAQVQYVRLPDKTTRDLFPTVGLQNVRLPDKTTLTGDTNALRPFTGQNDIATGFEPQNQFFTETFL
jgi:hypothetical protein